MSLRAAIYARMSTDKQAKESPADQEADCRKFAAARGYQVVEALVVHEPAISGASRHNRPLFLSLFDRIEEWDVLLVWDYSRLARDMEDYGWSANRCRDAGKTCYDVATGRDIDDPSSEVLAVFNAAQRRQIAERTSKAMYDRAARPRAGWPMVTPRRVARAARRS